MATNVTFKQQCPSCEAMVTIKDTKLVGKKIDCPKCKYRFVVDDPDLPEEKAPPKGPRKGAAKPAGKTKPDAPRRRRDDDDDEEPPKKKGGSGIMIGLGVFLGLVAIGLLIVVIVISRGGGGSSIADGNDPDPELPPDGPPDAVAVDVRNLLPNDTEAVAYLNNESNRFINGTLFGKATFQTAGGIDQTAFKNQLGFAPGDMAHYVRAESISAKWSFTVVRLRDEIKIEALAPMRLKPGPKSPIEKLEYYESDSNEMIDTLSALARGDVNPRVTANAIAGPLYVHLTEDKKTLIFADLEPMEKFLTDKGQPKRLTEVAPPPTADPGMGDMGMGDVGPGGRTGDGGVPTPDGGMPPENQPPKPTIPPVYLTIKPELKTVLDRIDNGRDPIIFCCLQDMRTGSGVLRLIQEINGTPGLQLVRTGLGGFAVHHMDDRRFAISEAVEHPNEAAARTMEAALRAFVPVMAQQLQAQLGIQVDTGQPMEGEQPGGIVGGVNARPADAGPGPRPGGPPPGVAGPGGAPFDPANPMQPEEPRVSTIRVSRVANTVVLSIDLALEKEHSTKLLAVLQDRVRKVRGMAAMVGTTAPRFHRIGDASNKFIERSKAIPPGTLPRKMSPAEETARLGRPYPPDQRISWMAALLPHMGQEDLWMRIRRNKSWSDVENRGAGQTLVPAFLNPSFPRESWWVRTPRVPEQDFAATHFVGVSGIGLDAAEFSANDKDHLTKLGMFGYDRVTRVEDVEDGLPNTIMSIQVPPSYKRPWIAGGGGTIQGVPESQSFQPFISMTSNGKRGTMAVMGDGSVRFLAEGVSDEIFKAMVTIRGREQVDPDQYSTPTQQPQIRTKPAVAKPKTSEEEKPNTDKPMDVKPITNDQ